MIKYLILFLLVIVYSSYAINYDFEGGDFWNVREYYYHILLEEWLKDANQKELTPTSWRTADYGTYERDSVRLKKIDILLKELYGINCYHYRCKNVGMEATFATMGDEYRYRLIRIQELPQKEQLWVLCHFVSGRSVWLKEKIDEPRWKKVKLPEIRDNNVYTALLRKLEFDGFYQCPPPRILNEPDGNGNIDSVRALAIAAESAAVCYDGEMTPIAAKLMGNNKEHWLVYCFRTVQDNAELQKICYRTAVNLYKKGENLWNWDLEYESNNNRIHKSEVVSVLISRKTGGVLFMEKTGVNCVSKHARNGGHISELPPSPPQTGLDYLR